MSYLVQVWGYVGSILPVCPNVDSLDAGLLHPIPRYASLDAICDLCAQDGSSLLWGYTGQDLF